MKIYTKTGDQGDTALIGGTRVSKHHIRVEAYGTVDELNAYLGLLRSLEIKADQVKEILEIQGMLFSIGALLAADPERSKMKLYVPVEKDVLFLEHSIDRMEQELEPLRHFILPGGDPVSAQAHIARCICRRAERLVVGLGEQEVLAVTLIKYLNRLSDYLFVLARRIAQDRGTVEMKWTAP